MAFGVLNKHFQCHLSPCLLSTTVSASKTKIHCCNSHCPRHPYISILLVLLWTSFSCVWLTLSWSFCQKVQRCPMRVLLTRNCPLATSWTVWSMRTPTGSSQWRPTRGGWWGLAVAVVFLMTSTLPPGNAHSTGSSSGEISMFLVGLAINLSNSRVTVPQAVMGLIVGRGGSHLKEIQKVSKMVFNHWLTWQC